MPARRTTATQTRKPTSGRSRKPRKRRSARSRRTSAAAPAAAGRRRADRARRPSPAPARRRRSGRARACAPTGGSRRRSRRAARAAAASRRRPRAGRAAGGSSRRARRAAAQPHEALGEERERDDARDRPAPSCSRQPGVSEHGRRVPASAESTRMARKRRTTTVRPKTPSRVKKRRAQAARRRTQHHPELIGLGLVALGLFLAAILWFGWDGGLVGGGDRGRRPRGRRRGRLPTPFALVAVGGADGRPQRARRVPAVPRRRGARRRSAS